MDTQQIAAIVKRNSEPDGHTHAREARWLDKRKRAGATHEPA